MPSRDTVQCLVLDTAPLLNSPLASLLPIGRRFVTTSDVLEEVRNKGQRERIEREWGTIQAVSAKPSSSEGGKAEWQGLQVRQPSAEGISKINSFARQTGDLAVLSSADIRVLALAYDIEVEQNGTWRLRDKVGGQRLGKDPEKRKARLERKAAAATPEGRSGDGDAAAVAEPASAPATETDALASSVADVDLDGTEETPEQPEAGPSSSANGGSNVEDPAEDDDADWSHVPVKPRRAQVEEDSDDDSIASDSDPSWITPDNVHLHKARDLGVFSSHQESSGSASTAVAQNLDSSMTNVSASVADTHDTAGTDATAKGGSEKGPTMKAALLTGDYAMQNVALQIGLNVLGVGGKRIRDVKTWVLRCYGCFKICKDPTRKFCPNCGGSTLTRVSITYTPSSPTGYVLHLKQNFQYRNRGTVYSIPSAKPGSASFDKGGARKTVNGASLVLREDQKEFQRGLKSAAVLKEKEERRLAKSAARGDDPSPFGGWNDPDWEPPMMLGEKGRKGQSGAGRGVQLGKDGLPVIGFGKNPNEVRRNRRR